MFFAVRMHVRFEVIRNIKHVSHTFCVLYNHVVRICDDKRSTKKNFKNARPEFMKYSCKKLYWNAFFQMQSNGFLRTSASPKMSPSGDRQSFKPFLRADQVERATVQSSWVMLKTRMICGHLPNCNFFITRKYTSSILAVLIADWNARLPVIAFVFDIIFSVIVYEQTHTHTKKEK